MWLTEFKKKWHEAKKAKFEAVKAKYEAINIKITTEEALIKKQIEKGVNELLPKIRQWMDNEKQKLGFINREFPSVAELKTMFLCEDEKIIEECIKILKDGEEIKINPFGSYSFSR